MKVLLCALNAKYIHSSLAPWMLRAQALAHGFAAKEVMVVEGTINQSDAALVEMIVARRPDVVGFSAYIWNIQTIWRLLPLIKRALPNAVILLGGPEVSYNSCDVLKELSEVDSIVAGEGEEAFLQLLEHWQGLREKKDVANLVWRDGGQIVSNTTAPPISALPFPYDSGYLAALGGRIAYAETARGCPFACTFCLSGTDESARFFPLDETKAVLLQLAQSGSRTIKLVDRTFNCNPKRAYDIFAFLIETQKDGHIPEGVCFHFEVGADLFDEHTLAMLQTAPAGLFQMEAGIQSFHAPTLEAIRRKTDITRLSANLRRILAMGNIHLHIDLIAGLPLEDLDTFAQSFNMAFAIRPHMLQLGFLKLLHGSFIRKQVADFGYRYSFLPPYEVSSSRWLTEDDVMLLHRVEDVVERMYNSGRFWDTIEYVLEATGLSAFALFKNMADYLSKTVCSTKGISKRDYAEHIYRHFAAAAGVESQKLRDAMVCDWLRSSDGHLPRCLQVADPRLGAVVRQQKRKGARTGIALLYADCCRTAVVDYEKRDIVTGRYAIALHALDKTASFVLPMNE